jgi:prepilin-type processing-associated H-X9-DG protein/prepilin-type N-terminal cleavage/methylation domain-containing protein
MNRMPDGFTLVEIMVCAAVISFLALICGVTVSGSIGRAHSAACLSNLRQWGVALHAYSGDHSGMLPRRGQGIQKLTIIDREDDWFNALPPYLDETPYHGMVNRGSAPRPGMKSVFVCPSAEEEPGCRHFLSYGMNMHLSRWDKPAPSRMANLGRLDNLVFMADSPGAYASTVPSSAGYSVKARHNGRANLLFADGHAESFDGTALGCGTGVKTHSGVRWKADESDPWNPP